MDIGRCRAVSAVSYLSLAWSKIWEKSLESHASPDLSVHSYFHFRFRDRNLSFRCRLMSDTVGSAIFGSGVVENVGVTVGIASLTLALRVLFPLSVSTSGFVADICVSDVG